MEYCHSSVNMHLVIGKFSQMGAVYKITLSVFSVFKLNRQVEKRFSITE